MFGMPMQSITTWFGTLGSLIGVTSILVELKAAALKDAFSARRVEAAINSEKLKAEHKAFAQGSSFTRFPPEPNGYLHIGHAKSMNLNFQGSFDGLGVPKEHRKCYFRYDDTNPAKESKEYIDNIAENVKWMGWTGQVQSYESNVCRYCF